MKIYIDGSSRGNQLGPGKRRGKIAVVMGNEEFVEDVGDVTNNQAEYMALIKALEMVRGRGLKKIDIYSDSELLVKQVKGEYKVRDPNLKTYYFRVMKLLRGLDVTLRWVPREDNLAGKLLEA
jgi:ribonuclease HI